MSTWGPLSTHVWRLWEQVTRRVRKHRGGRYLRSECWRHPSARQRQCIHCMGQWCEACVGEHCPECRRDVAGKRRPRV